MDPNNPQYSHYTQQVGESLSCLEALTDGFHTFPIQGLEKHQGNWLRHQCLFVALDLQIALVRLSLD